MGWSLAASVCAAVAVLSWRGSPAARLRQPRSEWGGRSRPPRQRVLGATATAVAALLLVAGVGLWGLALAAVVGVVSYGVLGRLQDASDVRRGELIAEQLPQVCDLLSVCLDSGLPLRQAADSVALALGGPLGERLGEVVAKTRLGVDETQAWSELASDEPELAVLGREVARTVGSGVALAGTLRAVGVDARRDLAAAAQVSARRVGVRSVLPLMICFLPAFMLLGVVPIIGGVLLRMMP